MSKIAYNSEGPWEDHRYQREQSAGFTFVAGVATAVLGVGLLAFLACGRKKKSSMPDSYSTESDTDEQISRAEVNAMKGQMAGKHVLYCQGKINEAQRNYDETTAKLLTVSRTREELRFKFESALNVNQRNAFKAEMDAKDSELKRLSALKSSRMRTVISMEHAFEALKQEESIISQPDEATFRRSSGSGGQHAQKAIREAGVSDEDRRYIVSYLDNKVETVE